HCLIETDRLDRIRLPNCDRQGEARENGNTDLRADPQRHLRVEHSTRLVGEEFNRNDDVPAIRIVAKTALRLDVRIRPKDLSVRYSRGYREVEDRRHTRLAGYSPIGLRAIRQINLQTGAAY